MAADLSRAIMNVEEIREARRQLETDITEIVVKFEEKSRCCVEGITVEHQGPNRSFVKIDADVRI